MTIRFCLQHRNVIGLDNDESRYLFLPPGYSDISPGITSGCSYKLLDSVIVLRVSASCVYEIL